MSMSSAPSFADDVEASQHIFLHPGLLRLAAYLEGQKPFREHTSNANTLQHVLGPGLYGCSEILQAGLCNEC